VTIGAQQDALVRFRPKLVERTRKTAPREGEALLGGIEMVEFERGGAPIVPAEPAAPTGLVD
jgi:hypothetical protein